MTVAVHCASRRIRFGDQDYDCAIGRNGAIAAAEKREGDGCTPLGQWPLRTAIVRPDRAFLPPPRLPWRWCRVDDGWCDDPASPWYNRPVRLPFDGSAEKLWRADDRYDVVLVIGYNDMPAIRGAGSAIFLHLRGGGATEGCVALEPDAMARLLCDISSGDFVDISDD